jgi:hypothetical protein
VAKERETMKKSTAKLAWLKQRDDAPRPRWPRNKPLPTFKSYEEEVRFWHAYDFEDGSPEDWQDLKYIPQATRHPREHVYRVRFDDQEMAALQAIAKRRGVSASVVLRELVRVAAKRAG